MIERVFRPWFEVLRKPSDEVAAQRGLTRNTYCQRLWSRTAPSFIEVWLASAVCDCDRQVERARQDGADLTTYEPIRSEAINCPELFGVAYRDTRVDRHSVIELLAYHRNVVVLEALNLRARRSRKQEGQLP